MFSTAQHAWSLEAETIHTVSAGLDFLVQLHEWIHPNSEGDTVSAQLHGPQGEQSDSETADFSLSASEIEKGERAAQSYLETVKAGDARRSVEEALDTLAAVISGGICGGLPCVPIR